LAENPNVFPENISIVMMPAIASPDAHQGQGLDKYLIILF